MTEETDAKTRAVNIVRQIIADDTSTVNMKEPTVAVSIASLVDAIADDLITADHIQAEQANTEERLQKVEAQTRVLSDAVVAIADPGLTVAPAIQAVKDEM